MRSSSRRAAAVARVFVQVQWSIPAAKPPAAKPPSARFVRAVAVHQLLTAAVLPVVQSDAVVLLPTAAVLLPPSATPVHPPPPAAMPLRHVLQPRLAVPVALLLPVVPAVLLQ